MNQSGMVSLQTDFGMSPDITSEVHVLTANYDAQYGNTTSGQIIINTKSGGEKFHGAAYEYLRNDALNATPYGGTKPPDKENDYGANIGGPILLPKLHGNSFVKGYFYFNWEGFQDHGAANSSTLSIASAAARQGNFGAWDTQLFYPNDPAKYGADAGQPIAYHGVRNQINPAYEDPVAKAWIAAMPTPTNGAEFNNYYVPKSGQGSLTNSENVYFWRADFNIGSKDHVYYTYWWQYSGINTASDLPIAISTASPANPENAPIQRLNWEHTFSDVMTNHMTVGYLNRNEGYYALNGHADLPKVPGVANPDDLPAMGFGSFYSGLGSSSPPDSSRDKTTRGTYAFNDVFTRVMGKHTLKAGFEWRLAGTSIHNGGNEGGSFTFNADTTGTNSTQLCPGGCPGDPMASFYLGAVGSASTNFYNIAATYPRQYGYAAHVGDTWRILPRLTLSYSLRWDYITPFKEKFNNLSFIDPLGANPGAISTATGQPLMGRLAFAGTKWGGASYGKDYPEIPQKHDLAPRLGVNYALNDKTVVRAGYGIYFGQAFYPGWNGGMSQDGFNKTVQLSESSSGAFKNPALYLVSGISAAQRGSTATSITPTYDNGTYPSMYRPLDGNKRPYSSQWNLTIERQLPHKIFGAVSYVGTKGTHLPSGLDPLNVLNPYNSAISSIGSDLSVSYTDPDGPAVFAAHGVSQPYVGWASQMTGCAPTLQQALLPYPQYCGSLLGTNEGHANSIYHSFQLHIDRHFTNGLYTMGSFTVQKLMTNSAFSTQSAAGGTGTNALFSPFGRSRYWALAPDNVPVTAQVAVVYELPFGANKAFLNQAGAANVLVAGWQVSPIYRYEYGTPFSFYSSNCATSNIAGYFNQSCVPGPAPGQVAQPHGRNGFNPATTSSYLNPAAFESGSAFSTFGYTGTGRAVSTVYGPTYQNWDISLTKNTKIAEQLNFKLEANFFNAFNMHALISQGNGPGSSFVTDVASSAFGTWNGNASAPRSIQFAGRLEF